MYHSGDQITKTEMGRACGMYGREERCKQGLGGKSRGKEATWKSQALMEGKKVKVDFNLEEAMKAQTGSGNMVLLFL
jgi:hypothetical protein